MLIILANDVVGVSFLSALLHIDGGYWHDILAVHDVLSLALCNKSVFSLLSPIVSSFDFIRMFLLSHFYCAGVFQLYTLNFEMY